MKHQILLVCLAITVGLVSWPAAAAPRPQGEPAAQAQQGAAEPGSAPVPPTLTLPVGTLITVRTTQMLSSDRNQPGDPFTTTLEQPLVAQGWVAARRGQTVMGRVEAAQKAGRASGVSQLAIELSELTMVDGQQVSIRTQLIQSSAGTSRAADRDSSGIGHDLPPGEYGHHRHTAELASVPAGHFTGLRKQRLTAHDRALYTAGLSGTAGLLLPALRLLLRLLPRPIPWLLRWFRFWLWTRDIRSAQSIHRTVLWLAPIELWSNQTSSGTVAGVLAV